MNQDRFSSVHDHCASCFSWKCTQVPDYMTSCELVDCELGCGKIFHACKYSQHKPVCEAAVMQCINKEYGCCVLVSKSKMAAHLFVCPANVVYCKRVIPDKNQFSSKICNKTFRREEFLWHSRNAHTDLSTGITSINCPLSCWQCDFSCPKLTLENPTGHVTNNDLNQCHAVILKSLHPENQIIDNSELYLENLPDNVLEYIILQLDSLSINCLSVTNKFFRSFCQSLLSKKGVVEPVWVRDENNERKWKIRKFVSTA